MAANNTEWYEADRRLYAEDLDAKYNPDGDGEHPYFTRWDWCQAVAQRSTLSGYWRWVEYSIEFMRVP